MKVIDAIAIIGALSWSIPLINHFKNKYIKPEIDIIFGKNAEVGYTTLGPIINMNMSFISNKKRALISRIIINVINESEGKHVFKWEWFEEELYETNLPNTGSMPTKKHQTAIALNLPQEFLIEKRIGFNDILFHKKNLELNQKIVEDFTLIIKNKEEFSLLTKKKSYDDYSKFFTQNFNWKPVTYKADVEIHLKNYKKIYKSNFKFSLNQSQITRLEENKEICQKSLLNYTKKIEDQEEITWNWVNPEIES